MIQRKQIYHSRLEGLADGSMVEWSNYVFHSFIRTNTTFGVCEVNGSFYSRKEFQKLEMHI